MTLSDLSDCPGMHHVLGDRDDDEDDEEGAFSAASFVRRRKVPKYIQRFLDSQAQESGSKKTDDVSDDDDDDDDEDGDSTVAMGGGGRNVVLKGACAPAARRQAEDRAEHDPRLARLLTLQNEWCPRALEELELTGRKQSHWMWWVFPTEMEGTSEPEPRTAVTRENATNLLARAPLAWRAVLEKIGHLVKTSGVEVLPQEDHGRVKHFATFWRAMTPPRVAWMCSVLDVLERYFPPESTQSAASAIGSHLPSAKRRRGSATAIAASNVLPASMVLPPPTALLSSANSSVVNDLRRPSSAVVRAKYWGANRDSLRRWKPSQKWRLSMVTGHHCVRIRQVLPSIPVRVVHDPEIMNHAQSCSECRTNANAAKQFPDWTANKCFFVALHTENPHIESALHDEVTTLTHAIKPHDGLLPSHNTRSLMATN